MVTLKDMPSPKTILTAYASFAGSIMFAQSIIRQFVPREFQSYFKSKVCYMLGFDGSRLTMIIDESCNGMSRNQLYDAAEIYLRTKINPSMERLKVSKAPRDKKISVTFEKSETIFDTFEGIRVRWKYTKKSVVSGAREKRCYELSFDKKHMEKVQESYLPYVLKKSRKLKEENRERPVKLLTCGGDSSHSSSFGTRWGAINLEHPATFDTLAMEPELKRELIEDLDRFVSRREYYKRVGKVWKRGYLLYGPPGTGKSSLIAAMANYLKFDIYDLELANLSSNSSLRNLLVSTHNRSILVIEDIDCTTVNLKDRESRVVPRSGEKRADPKEYGVVPHSGEKKDPKLTLSGLLNFIDGLWSSCGDEKIIVFTTNHKDKLDPALLRPGRMDMHIHMSYCTPNGFRLLAGNYLSIHDHSRFGEIDELLQESQVTPAEVAEELMKSDNVDVSLDGLVKFLKRKKMEVNEVKDDGHKEQNEIETADWRSHNGEGSTIERRINLPFKVLNIV